MDKRALLVTTAKSNFRYHSVKAGNFQAPAGQEDPRSVEVSAAVYREDMAPKMRFPNSRRQSNCHLAMQGPSQRALEGGRMRWCKVGKA
jgi:hypothetical protein